MNFERLVITDHGWGGNFGSVFVCKLDEKKVAAKRLSRSEKEFDNLMREASKLKRLRYGKYIVYIYGITLKNGNLHMVMEYYELGDLQNYLEKNKESITYEQKLLFCRGILLGLLYCHSMKIFHGDIKCENVILDKNLEPKLADFGLSMTVDNIEYYSKIYKGSMYWIAPELFSIKDDEVVYQEFITNPYPCDVYSLGAIFCEISYDGTTEFIDSNDPGTDIMLGLVFPIPKDAFLEEIVGKCCQYARNERILLDDCLHLLDVVAEAQLLVPEVNDEWSRIQQDIRVNSEIELPPSFILYRPAKNLVVGPSNLSLLEWVCINNCVDAVKYMTQLCEYDQNQIEWLCEISELCKSLDVASFLQSFIENREFPRRKLSNLVDSNPEQFIEMLIKAGANSCNYDLLKEAIERRYNVIVQAIIDSRKDFKNLAIHDAVKFGNAEALRILAGADFEMEDYHTGNTPLITAIESGKIEVVKILLELGVDIKNNKNSTQTSVEARIQHRPLYLAALRDNREIVKLLIDAGATIDITSSEWPSLCRDLEQQGNVSMGRFIRNSISEKSSSVKNNTLHAAIQNKQPDLVQTLINNGEDIYEIGLDGYAPLHWAVIVGDEEIVRILIKAGADLDIKTQNFDLGFASDYLNDCTPLHIATLKRHLGIAKVLIESGADFSVKNGLQQTIMDIPKEDKKEIEKIIREHAPINAISIQRAVKSISHENIKIMFENRHVNAEILSEFLCIAASSGENDLVEYLLKHRVNVNKGYQGKSPLEWAIFGGNIQATKILINAGADINVKNDYQETPLFRSVWESQTDIVRLLMYRDVDVNIRNALEYKPIHYAKNREATEIPIEADADINAKNQYETTLLIQSVIRSNKDMVQFLVDKGANLNAKSEDGYAPIHYAYNKEIMKILINAGADINTKNQYGGIPLIEYVKKSNTEMVQYLVDKGADINARDEDGNAPIHFVRNKKIAEILITAGANINAKDRYGKELLDTLMKDQNKNLSNRWYRRKSACNLLEYLRNINKV